MFNWVFLAVSMFTISDRDNFWDAEVLSHKTQYAEVDEQGITKILNEIQIENFWASLKDKNILLLIHGFNSPLPYWHYHNIRVNIENLNLDSPYDCIIGYVWPSFDDAIEYRMAKRQVQQVKPVFANTLSKMHSLVRGIDVIAHSMGNRLLLETLDGFPQTSFKWVRNFFSWAPAIDNESVDIGQWYYPATQRCENMYVFFSRNDAVLKWAYFLPELDIPLGLFGNENPSLLPQNIQLIDCSDVVNDHSAYMLSKPVYDYLQKVRQDVLFTPMRSKNVRIKDTGDSEVMVLR